MWLALRTHKILFLSFAMIMIGSGLQGTLITLRALSEGFSNTIVGLIMASYYCGYLISVMRAGKFIAKVGHIRVFAALTALCSITILLHHIYINPWFWIVIRFLTGACLSGLFIICESWLNAKSSNEQRGQSIAAYMIVFYLASSIGQLFFFIAEPESFLLFSIASIAISLASIPLLVTQIRTPMLNENAPTSMPLSTLYRRSPLGVVGTFIASFTISIIGSLAPMYATNSGFSNQQAGWVVMALNLGCVLLMSPIGSLSDKFDRRKVMAATATISALISIALLFAHSNFTWLLALFVLLGGFTYPLTSIANAYINDWLQTDEIVPAAGTIVLIYGLGAILGPFAGGTLINYLGNNSYFAINLVAMIAFISFALYRMTQRSLDTLHEHSVTHAPLMQPSAETLISAYDDRQLSFDFELETIVPQETT